jgi:hypothetical protein
MFGFVVIFWAGCASFILGLPLLIIGAVCSMTAEKIGKGIDWYFERRVARRGYRL